MSSHSKRTSVQASQGSRLLAAIVVLALSGLACSIGVLTPSDPLFAAPANADAGLGTPVMVFATPTEQGLPATPAPEAAEAGVPEAVEAPPEAPPAAPTMDPNIAPILYYTQAGDTLPVVAVRFGVAPEEIMSPDPLPEQALLPANQLLVIPHRLANTTSSLRLLPDSEVIFSPSAVGMDLKSFVAQAGGYLSAYREWLGTTAWTPGADVIYRVGLENSINPRLLLALLEYQAGWVYGQPANFALRDYPMGKIDLQQKDLYQQLAWAVNHLSVGYYGWREGLINEIRFSDGVTARLAPDLNAGTVALQYYFAQIYDSQRWIQAIDPVNGFAATYERMFGSPWIIAQQVEPLYPPDLTQPEMILPFFVGQTWAFTGGPHGAWEHDGARAALDFSPGRLVSGCVESDAWVLAVAAGLVVRSEKGVVVIDLDGDGSEQTGWAVLYLHIATEGRVPLGTWVETSDLIGHPSCEGGRSTGTHVHIARKYNGEWIPAAGPLPFNLDGWTAHAGEDPYEGTLTRNEETIWASVVGSFESRIIRQRSGP
jgi:murein DD-endopeptidase MepM/ murein hydrolase activator NlpD